MDLALREKAGGKQPPDLSAQILAKAEEPVTLSERRRGVQPAQAYGSYVPLAVSVCLLALAFVSAALLRPEAATRLADSRDGELLRAYLREEEAQEKLSKLVDRFNTLVGEQRYAEAEVVAKEAQALVPESPVTDVLVGSSESRNSADDIIVFNHRNPNKVFEVTRWDELSLSQRRKERQAAEHGKLQMDLTAQNFNHKKRKKGDEALGLRFQIEDTRARLPDDPAVVYPDARTWAELSIRRKKYQSNDVAEVRYSVNGKSYRRYVPVTVCKSPDGRQLDRPSSLEFAKGDFSGNGIAQFGGFDANAEYAKVVARTFSEATVWHPGARSAAAKINSALADPTYIEFDKTPIKDAVDYLKDLHGIEIQLDESSLKSVGISTDKPITYHVKGPSLRTSLNDLLDGYGLTYHIKNEVLQITTPEAAGIRVGNVQGQITAVSEAAKLVEVSLGSDDGLRVGRVLNAIREDGTVLQGGLRVLKTSPDRAVAEVVVADAGPLVKGFKVSGKVFDLPPEPEVVPEPVPAEPDPAGDKFDLLPENDFEMAKDAPLSTFSIDVDTASYSKVRQFLMQAGQLPPAEAVRLEELVNYFPYDYAPPQHEQPFAAHVETAACPWNAAHRLVRIALKGKVIEAAERPACNLVFLVDVSGSMDEPNKLPLVTNGLKMLAGELSERDRVSIVVYAGAAGMVLPPTSGDAKPTIYSAISELKAGGSTNGGEGIELAYKTCQENFLQGGVNRVILCTDGDFNVGLTSTGQLVDLAKERAQKGVFLSVLGFGMGNHNDEMLEAVSNKANGNHAFIDSLNEAKKVLVREISGTLVTIAKDVKIQVDFNPEEVASYRLLGYENRMLAAEDFADDKKDAGEIGGGHTVTALYEVVPTPTRRVSEGEKRQPAGKLLTLKLRYKQPDGDKSELVEYPFKDSGKRFGEATPDFQFAAAVASFGMLLRKSKHAGDATFDSVTEIAAAAKGADPHGYRAEFVELVKRAKELGAK